MKVMNKKGFTIIEVVLVLGVLAAGVWGYFALTKQEPKPEATNNEVVSDETADWKTYTDQKNEYSFRYPQTYTLEQAEEYAGNFDKKLTGIRIINKNQAQGGEGCFNAGADRQYVCFSHTNFLILEDKIPTLPDYGTYKGYPVTGIATVNNLKVSYIEGSVENEGRFSFFVPITTNKTLVVSKNFSTEEERTNLYYLLYDIARFQSEANKDAKDFYQIFKTLSISK